MSLIRKPFVMKLERSLGGECHLASGERVVVAVSGGADSVALLRGLAAIGERSHWQLDLHVGHVHHHLRDEADGEVRFVEQLAMQLGLPFYLEDIYPGKMQGNLESNAREQRYDALQKIAARVDGDCVVTAHHGDDQLETLLMRLIRGASIDGMSGISPVRPLGNIKLLRPMLGLSRKETIDFLNEIGQNWRDDHTNADTSRWRAKLRHEVLPVLRELRSDAVMKSNETAQSLRQVKSFVDAQVDTFCKRNLVIHDNSFGEQRIEKYVELDRAIARKTEDYLLGAVVRKTCINMGANADQLGKRVIEQIANATKDRNGEKKYFELNNGVTVEIGRSVITWRKITLPTNE